MFGKDTDLIEFDLIHPIESLTVTRFYCSEKFYEERLQNTAAFVLKLVSGLIKIIFLWPS